MSSTDDLIRRGRQFYAQLPELLDGISGGVARARAYRAALADAGLAGIDYPVELGGLGRSPAEAAAFRAGVRDLLPEEDAIFGIGIGMALPTIRDHGSDHLARRFVPPGLRGDEIWCQLYSEPGSGSDLAALTTRAVRDGDEWVVTGQKVWTSGAQHSQLGVLLARTDVDLPKHRGITMFVLPMEQPGVTVRPLVQMTGAAEFNEVFLDEARVPADWVVGEVNGGWPLAVALLAHERSSLGKGETTVHETRSKTGRSPLPFAGLVERARERGLDRDPIVRQELARVWSGEQIVPHLAARDVHPSLGKLWRTKQGRLAAQVAHVLGGAAATAWEPGDAEQDYWAYHVLNCRGMSLGGGTDEIQRTTLGERLLGLPREPGPARDTPFRELPNN